MLEKMSHGILDAEALRKSLAGELGQRVIRVKGELAIIRMVDDKHHSRIKEIMEHLEMLLDDQKQPINDEDSLQEWLRYCKTVIEMIEDYCKPDV